VDCRNRNRVLKIFIVACAVFCSVIILIPIWSADVLPFTDYPVHLALIQASGFSFNTPDTLSERFYVQWFTPYSATYMLARLISVVTSVETTGKLLLSLYLILTPLLFMRLLKLLNKPAYLAFPTFLMLYNFNLVWGFLPFLVAIPLMLETLNQSIRFRQNTTSVNGLAVCLIVTVLFFTHVFALFTALCFYLFLLIHSCITDSKFKLALLLPVIPAVTMTAVWRITLTLTEADAAFLDKGLRFAPLSLKFRFFSDYVISGDPGWTSRIIFSCMAVIILLRFLPVRNNSSVVVHSDNTNDHKQNNTSSALVLSFGLAAVIWLLYVSSPYSWLTAVWLFNRIAFLATAFFLLLLPASSRFSPFIYVTSITILCGVLMWTTCQRYYAFCNESRPGLSMMAEIPPEKSLRFVALNAGSAYTDHRPYTHFGHYYQVRHNGLIHNPFAVLTHIPVQYKPAFKTVHIRFQPEPAVSGNQFRVNLAYDRHDFFIFRLAHFHTPDVIAGVFQQNTSKSPEFIGKHNEWALFSRMETDL
jgi:hypothetical protein